jgi:tellurite resistance protein TerC
MSTIDVPAWAWGLLGALFLGFISIDLIAHRNHGADSKRRAIMWSAVWIGAALAFNAFVAIAFGAEAGEQFLAAYLLEKSLSVDNLFLFLVIFGALGIPAADQHRVLTFGIVGAVVTRCVFIVAGVAALHRWHEITYVFGAILVVTSLKLLRTPDKDAKPPRMLEWLERHVPWSRKLDGHRFFTRNAGRLVATPLLVALITIELTDVVFALDSIPAAFAVSDNVFILYSSNVFAVLGLRALYVVLAGALQGLRHLRFGLAAVLAFAGIKMLLSTWVEVSSLGSVAIIATCITVSIVTSVVAARKDPANGLRQPEPGSSNR